MASGVLVGPQLSPFLSLALELVVRAMAWTDLVLVEMGSVAMATAMAMELEMVWATASAAQETA